MPLSITRPVQGKEFTDFIFAVGKIIVASVEEELEPKTFYSQSVQVAAATFVDPDSPEEQLVYLVVLVIFRGVFVRGLTPQ